MRKAQFITLVVLGAVLLVLVFTSRSLTQWADKAPPNPPPQKPAEPKKADDPKPEGGGPFVPIPRRGERGEVRQPQPQAPPKGRLSALLKELDKNGDGKISLAEWTGSPADFRELDRNSDGFITPDEVVRDAKSSHEMKLTNGRGESHGEIQEREEPYRGKKSYTVITVKLQAGKTYQIDLNSRVFQSFVYLEDAAGNVLEEYGSPFIGGLARVTHKVTESGNYRIVVTSLAGVRTGPYTCTVSMIGTGSGLPRGLAAVLKELDKDGDSQIGLYEWKGSAADFRQYDLNKDGFITPDELQRYLRQKGE